jgi:uncharacterized protein YciI
MWYVIYSFDRENSLEQRLQMRPQHLARLQDLLQQGRVLVAGPRPAIDAADPGPAGFLGSLVVGRFESLEAAREWADDDPYMKAGVYEKVEVSPFNLALPK